MKIPPEHDAIRSGSFDPSGTVVEFPMEDVETSIPERFEKIARLCPDRLAVKTEEGASTYDALNRAADRIAHAIWEQCGDNNDPVAILVRDSSDTIATILGVLKAGKIYLPLDLTLPLSRLRYLIEDSRATLLITDIQSVSTAQQLSNGKTLPILIPDTLLDVSVPSQNPKIPIAPDRLAAILYTSGSTAAPKGVVHNHRTLLHLARRYSQGYRLHGTDRIALLRTLAVIGGTTHTLGALLNGAALFPFDLKRNGILNLIGWLRAQQVTMCSFGPKLLRSVGEIVHDAEPLTSLRRVTLSGEPVHKADIDLCRRLFPADCMLVNSLGATEAPVALQYAIQAHEDVTEDPVPVGYPTEGFKVTLRGENGESVEDGAVGEIVLQSRYLAVGYWGNPDLTQAKFLSASDNPEERTYLTGDLGRHLPDGKLLHLGRRDLMVKIRGYRVELEEIERNLMKHPQVKEAGVTAWERNKSEKYLAAYIVPRGPIRPTIDRLQSFLREMIPDYMVPSTFMFSEALPVTNGKLDRKALPEPDHKRPELSAAYALPTTEVEKSLVSIWETILDVRPIGIHDNFFDLGGHSLLAAKMFAIIDEQFARTYPLSLLLSSPTIKELAEHFSRAQETRQNFTSLIPLRSRGDRPPIFAVPGVYGNVLGYARLAREWGDDQPFYALQSVGLDGLKPPIETLEEMAKLYISEIRAVQRHGPYVIIGACFGATVAYEMARQLLAAGQVVAYLGLIDPSNREYRGDGFISGEHIEAWNKTRTFLSLLSSRMKLYGEELRNTARHERIQYVLRKGFSIGATLTHGNKIKRLTRELHQLEVARANRTALRRYRREPLIGPLTTFEVFESNHPRNRRSDKIPWPMLWSGDVKVYHFAAEDSGELINTHGGELCRLISEHLELVSRSQKT